MLADHVIHLTSKHEEDLTYNKAIANSEKFTFDVTSIMALNNIRKSRPASFISALSFAKLPFINTWFEWHEDGFWIGALLEQVNDHNPGSFYITCWVKYEDLDEPMALTWLWSNEPISNAAIQDMGEDGIWLRGRLCSKEEAKIAWWELSRRLLFFPNKYSPDLFDSEWTSGDKIPEEIVSNALLALTFILAALILINSKNCVSIVDIDKDKINRKRLKKNKKPFFSYKTVKLDISRSQQKRGIASNMTAAEMRQHLVRGHFKVRKSGVYWWNSFIRGRQESGVIHHRKYDVVNSAP